MVALRSGELYHFIGRSFGVCHDRTTCNAYLCVTVDITDFSLTSLPIYYDILMSSLEEKKNIGIYHT